jgi:lactoylglutathione lyase
LRFFCEGLGLRELRRRDSEQGRFTLVFLGERAEDDSPQIELTYNWDQQDPYTVGRNFGHVAYEVDDIYAACQRFIDLGYPINRPPRDGRMAFVRSPDAVSIELLQRGDALPPREPWSAMANVGEW